MLQGTTAHYLTHSTFPLEGWRHLPRPRRCRRHRRAHRADGQAPRRPRVRHGVERREGAAGEDPGRRRGDHPYTTQDFETEVKRPPTAVASTSSMTRSARPRSTRASTCCVRAGQWRSLDNRAARCRHSIRQSQWQRFGSSSPGLASRIICSLGRIEMARRVLG